jgi:hypothetical protein
LPKQDASYLSVFLFLCQETLAGASEHKWAYNINNTIDQDKASQDI